MTPRAAAAAARARRLEAEGWARLYAARLESGEIPSAIVDGRRVEVLRVQEHPVAGRRYLANLGATTLWFPAAQVEDVRGEVLVSTVSPEVAARIRADLTRRRVTEPDGSGE